LDGFWGFLFGVEAEEVVVVVVVVVVRVVWLGV
jgi:hypothetical protein